LANLGLVSCFRRFFYGPENALCVWYLYMFLKSVDRAPAYLATPQIDERDSVVRGERRRRARVQVHWPLSFIQHAAAEIVETVTHDLSSDGFYCLVNTAFVPGEIRECTLGVPMHHPNSGDRVRPVLCRVRVIRVEALGEDGTYGVGCRIEDYRFMSPESALQARERDGFSSNA
jgi:hypothetical protein